MIRALRHPVVAARARDIPTNQRVPQDLRYGTELTLAGNYHHNYGSRSRMNGRTGRPLRMHNFVPRTAAALVLMSLVCLAEPIQDSAASADSVTFTRDIAPLLQSHCQECHRPGQSAPMSLMTYAEVRPWAKAIERNVTLREMPPFHATGAVGRYMNDPRLTDDEIAKFAGWVKAGAPLGDAADLPKPIAWSDDEWLGGKPDLVIKMPRYDIRTDGVDDNVDLYSEYVFPEDLWLRSVELRPSNRPALHHANVFLTFEDEVIPKDLFIHEMKRDLVHRPFVMQWLPGRTFDSMPDGQAIHVFSGRRILLNAHYAPSIEPQFDQTQVALYFADGTIDTFLKQIPIMLVGKQTPIEPYDQDYSKTFRRTFDADVLVTDFHFHMHYRGRSASVSFKQPDGTIVPGIEIPAYNFNWQRKYSLAEPLSLPKGTEATIRLHWDNSAANPQNPDPSKRVEFGLLTTDEMGSASIWYRDPESKLDPPIVVRNGRAVDAP